MSEKVINTDVVVAGTGGTGLAAAYAAAQKGLKVTVVEKLPQIGGNTKISSGFFAIDSKDQREKGMHLTKEEAINQLMNYNHYLANGALINKIVNSAADTLEWLKTMGMEIKLNDTSDTTQFAHRGNDYSGGSYHMYQNKDESYSRIQKTLEEANVQFIFNTTLTELQSENGKITGIVAAEEGGTKIIVNAKATVIATGGFGGNIDKVSEVMKTDTMRSLGVPNMGEGLEAMEANGAVNIDATALIHAAQLAKSTVTQKTSNKHLAGFSNTPLTRLLLTPQLWVNLNGQRFTNEDTVYDTVEWANAGWSAGGKYYFIVDQATLDSYTNDENKLEVSKAGPGATTDPGNFTELAEGAVAGETAYKGNTIEELAKNSGMDPDVLINTIEKYNHVIDNEDDTEFAKSTKSLVYSVKQAPFYAFTSQVAYLGTIGGVRVDDELRVLDKNFKPIPGLFTGGTNAGGYYEGHSYPAYEGLASGFSWTSGRIAGTSAAEFAES